jgi:excisionase family DNA binding protein
MQTMAVPGELLTVHEVAGKLKVKPATVRQMARDGGLPGLKVGSDWRFDWCEVVDYLKSTFSNQSVRASA